MLKPRFYQQESHDAAIAYMKRNSTPVLLSLPMGAGKSIIVAMMAKTLHKLSGGKRVLCLCPSKELVEQNFEKYTSIGEKASIYSASISKSLRHPVIFATEQSIIKVIDKISQDLCAIIIDEAHTTNSTIKGIVEKVREHNPNVRIAGLTATPYRTFEGYCYEIDDKDRIVQDAKDPYFKKLAYSISASELITLGYLTPPMIGAVDSHYDTSKLELKNGKFLEKDLEDTFVGKSVTSEIIRDVISKTKGRKSVLIFAATMSHMEEIFKLLPESEAACVSGKTPKKERERIINDFKTFKIKYLVNVSVLTTGFDHPALDAIAILRNTVSAGLYQQVIGRGTRLYEGKKNFLVLDYTDNIPQFFGDSTDVFQPNIKVYGSSPSPKIEFSCPECGTTQEGSKRNGFESFSLVGGYATDLAGDLIKTDDGQFMPAHHSRRCVGIVSTGINKFERCSFFWAHKQCPSCQHKNDIAARNCSECGLVLISPDEKLNPVATVIPIGQQFTTRVDNMTVKQTGDITHVLFNTPHGELKCRFFPKHNQPHVARHGWAFQKATEHGTKTPTYVVYTLQKSGYCSINKYMFENAFL